MCILRNWLMSVVGDIFLLATAVIYCSVSSVVSLEWHYFERSAYVVHTGSYKTWNEGLTYCESIGASLTSVSSVEENSFVRKLSTSNPRLWIGLNDQQAEGVWEWTMGTDISDFTYWDENVPTNDENANCVSVDLSEKWFVEDCVTLHYAICETDRVDVFQVMAVSNTIGQLVCMKPDALTDLTIASKLTRSLIECFQYCVAVGHCDANVQANAFQVQQTSDRMMCHLLVYEGDLAECLESQGCNLYVMV